MVVAGRMMRGTAFLAALGVLVAVARGAERRLDAEPPAPETSELVYVPEARLLRPLALGYDNVLADVLWFRTINYFGAHYVADRAYPWLARMCDVVTDLDPKAQDVYRFGGVILPWEAHEVDEGLRILEKGVRAMPEAWMSHYLLGISLYYFRDDYDGAVEHLRVAAGLPGAPLGTMHMAAVLLAKGHGSGTTVAFLREMYNQTTDPHVREVIAASLREAELGLYVEQMKPLVETYRKRYGRVPASADALVQAGLLRAVPPDPFGGTWVIDPATGAVRSSTGHEARKLAESPGIQKRRQSGFSSEGGA